MSETWSESGDDKERITGKRNGGNKKKARENERKTENSEKKGEVK